MRRFAPVLLIAICCACSDGPRAPVLHDSPVFQSDSDGFRFLMPDDYKLKSRSDLPSGRIEGDRVLVQYHRYGSGKPASFEVTRRDDWTVETLDTILLAPSHGVQKWVDAGKGESVDLGGTPGQRRVLQGVMGKDRMAKEIVAFRRGDRGYFFVMLSRSGDESARNHFRRIIDGLTWLD
jgi:hypothetical protein